MEQDRQKPRAHSDPSLQDFNSNFSQYDPNMAYRKRRPVPTDTSIGDYSKRPEYLHASLANELVIDTFDAASDGRLPLHSFGKA